MISVGPYNLPPGVPPGRAVLDIRGALAALPGAGWISVEHHPGPCTGPAIHVTPAIPGLPPHAANEAQLRVEAAVARVLAHLQRQTTPLPNPTPIPVLIPVPIPVPPPSSLPFAAPAGLAERPVPALRQDTPDPFLGASVLDALAALETLALAAAPTPEPPHPPAEASVAPSTGPENDLARLDDEALLATLLAHALPPAAAGPAARRALARFGSFAAVLSQPAPDLLALPGVGPHAAAAIKLVHEAALRRSRATVLDPAAPISFEALVRHLTAVLAREPLEHFRVLFLDAAGHIRADEAQARGTVNHTPVYPREVARRALELHADAVILVHNHPSGDPSPSPDDHAMTASVQDACAAVGVRVHDHIIVGNGRWFSFRQENCLPPT